MAFKKKEATGNPIGKLAKLRAAKLQQDVQRDRFTQRQAFIDRIMTEGGKPFVESLKRGAKNDKGEPVIMTDWAYEYAELIGDFRIHECTTTGCAQLSKSLMHNLCMAFYVAEGSLNTIFSFALDKVRQKLVPLQQIPILRYWADGAGVTPKTTEAAQNTNIWQANGGSAMFVSVNASTKGDTAAGSNVVSVSVDAAFLDEFSQYQSGSDDPIYRRLDNGRIPTQPVRRIGTPGNGQGSELMVERAEYNFYPHCTCESCGNDIALHPFGALFRPSEKELPNGDIVVSYLADSGRPVRWYHKDPSNQVDSACFACPLCNTAISDENRARKAFFKCLKTGIRLREFLDSYEIPKTKRTTVGITISPLLRDRTDQAVKLVRTGLETANVKDYCQQLLGIPSTSGGTGITEADIKRSMQSPHRFGAKEYDYIFAGIDQGRSSDWLVIFGVKLPQDKKLSLAQIYEQAYREILFAGDIERNSIPDFYSKYAVTWGLVDSEPSIEAIAAYTHSLPLGLCDQQAKQVDVWKEAVVRDGGEEFPCYKIRYQRFMREVNLNFTELLPDGYPRLAAPQSWSKWFTTPTERSPVRHLTAVTYDPDTGDWCRPTDSVDHVYFAHHFAEAAFYIYLNTNYCDNWFAYV